MARWSRPDRIGQLRSRPPARRRATRRQRRREDRDRDRCATPDGPLDAQQEPGVDHSTASQGSTQRDPPPNLDLLRGRLPILAPGLEPVRDANAGPTSAAGAVGLLSAGSKPVGRRLQGMRECPRAGGATYAAAGIRGRTRRGWRALGSANAITRRVGLTIQIVANHAPARASTKWRMRSRAPAGSGLACRRMRGCATRRHMTRWDERTHRRPP
jgi:hypothetical protein